MKIIKISLSIFFLLLTIWLVGPKPETPVYSFDFPSETHNLRMLEDSINKAEASNKDIKVNNEARILWADSSRQRTAWVIVYLHGFTASQMEGAPVHRDIAAKFGMNLYLARLSEHGLASDSALIKLTPDRLWETAKLALAIGEKLGDKVILMSTSTGGTLALKLAEMYPKKVAALINYSPNVAINNPLARAMNNHWGHAILNNVFKNGIVDNSATSDSLVSQYWTTIYRTEALVELQELVETTMTKSVFNAITCPSLTLAYYKDDEHQDPTVKVSAIRWMNDELGTPEAQKKLVEMPTVGVHPMASELRSDDIDAVKYETIKFIKKVLRI